MSKFTYVLSCNVEEAARRTSDAYKGWRKELSAGTKFNIQNVTFIVVLLHLE